MANKMHKLITCCNQTEIIESTHLVYICRRDLAYQNTNPALLLLLTIVECGRMGTSKWRLQGNERGVDSMVKLYALGLRAEGHLN